jgi:transcriptional regulator with XRE-family HTH domain
MDHSPEQQEKQILPMVAIDGAAAKNLRERGKLTQLYVASVVGVTMDTISRWENNRYPSIKRENAEKLAHALGVELAAILRAPESPLPHPVPELPVPGRNRWLLLFAPASLLLVIVFLLARTSTRVVREVPRHGAPGEALPVRLVVSGGEQAAGGVIIKEKLPPGWRLVKAEPAAASTGSEGGELKWLLPPGPSRRSILYTVRPAAVETNGGEVFLEGYYVFRKAGLQRSITIGGDRRLAIDGRHWADVNGDGLIDDNEIMPAYYLCEEMKSLGLDWKTIEAIWSGKGYRWDPVNRSFLVLR